MALIDRKRVPLNQLEEAATLEQFPIRLDRSIAPDLCLNAFSSREPASLRSKTR
jgi:hypothetical protein